jgi:hypothetical protein
MKLEEVIIRDTRGNQPAATTVPTGTIYYVTDETVTERSNGTTWDDISDGGTGGGGITQLTGNVTAGPGVGSQAATIVAEAVTYAKMQHVSAVSKLLGRGSAAGAGDVEEITLGANLTMTGTSLAAAGGGGIWTYITSWTYASDVTHVDFINLSAYNEILIMIRGMTSNSGSSTRCLRVSVDNGANFLTTSGDYLSTTEAGGSVSATYMAFHLSPGTAAKSGWYVISLFNQATYPKIANAGNFASDGGHFMIPTASALNAIQVISNAGNITGGDIYVYGR